jgi:K(+)-stimulated pyrophosphate-energized sodium pump
MDASGISSFLTSQKSTIAAAMPAGLDLGNLFGSFSAKAPDTLSHATETVHHYTEEPVEKKNAAMAMILPLLLLILAGAAAWYFYKDGCRSDVEHKEVASENVVSGNDHMDAPAVAGKIDTATGDFIYEMGENVSITLPNNAGTLTVGKYSTENKLVSFLNDKSAMLDSAKGNWFEFTNVRFKTGGSEITETSMEQLKNLVAISKGYPTASFKIGGYTDSTGNGAANVVLSQKRADAVAAMLKQLGIAAAAIEGSKGYGKEWPLADNATAEGRAQNRRVAVNVKTK